MKFMYIKNKYISPYGFTTQKLDVHRVRCFEENACVGLLVSNHYQLPYEEPSLETSIVLFTSFQVMKDPCFYVLLT